MKQIDKKKKIKCSVKGCKKMAVVGIEVDAGFIVLCEKHKKEIQDKCDINIEQIL